MDAVCFPGEVITPRAVGQSWWWVVTVDGRRAGYCGLRAYGEVMFLSRAGVLPEYRGRGLQRRLIRRRLQFARAAGGVLAVTYTAPGNPASGNSLIGAGFRLYEPRTHWAGREFIYWRKAL